MIDDTIQADIARHEALLQTILAETNIPAPRIKQALTYVLFPGGKRLRPQLVYLCGRIIDAKPSHLDAIAVAIELMHCYSLVHDDLPAMDNDDMRRGKPSCHRAFDEATAILTGDSLQVLSIEVLITYLTQHLPHEKISAIVLELVQASGASGMVSGQSLDLSELSHDEVSETTLREIHLLKTGKLISACINMVLLTCTVNTMEAQSLRQFASEFGLAFQMRDDYLDQYGTLGKNRASDKANKKNTFASLYDQTHLADLISRHYQQALKALTPFGARAETLSQLVQSLLTRN